MITPLPVLGNPVVFLPLDTLIKSVRLHPFYAVRMVALQSGRWPVVVYGVNWSVCERQLTLY